MRTWFGVGVVIVVVILGASACSSSSSKSSSTTTSGASATTSASGAPSTAGCPTAAVVSKVMGSAYTGPVTGTNGGTAPCVYSGTDEVNVLFNTNGSSKSQFATQAKSDMGPTAASVPGVGGEAYASTAYGHAEIEVWESATKTFSITIDDSTGTVPPNGAANAEALAKAIVAG
jgi:hypothetical protein